MSGKDTVFLRGFSRKLFPFSEDSHFENGFCPVRGVVPERERYVAGRQEAESLRLEGWRAACSRRAGQEERRKRKGAAAALVPEPWLAFRQGNGENARAWSKLRRKTVRLPARIIIHEYERSGIVETLEWRYATKVFNPDRRIPAEDWEALLESLHLSPSSLGLQMWKFLDVRDPAVRSRLREVSWGQPQVTDASHLVVFCARRDFKSEDVQRYLERIVEVRGVAMDSLDQYRARIFELVGSKSPEVLKAWLERQVYIALGFMMSCAADLRVDTCALEGMDPAAYDRILHLENSPYYTLCALALGYRNEEADKYARLAKVRFDRDEVIPVI